MKKIRILFICTGNSCRSQMAEGYLRYKAADRYEALSAGTIPQPEVNPLAIIVMNEVGIDISKQYPKHLKIYLEDDLDFIVTVCDDADRNCPVFPRKNKKMHWSFKDPAQVIGSKEERLKEFRAVRDLIFKKIDEFLM
ncbi:MAG: arsenate reductase ArsC [Candidatus Helarchaeota archaeon]